MTDIELDLWCPMCGETDLECYTSTARRVSEFYCSNYNCDIAFFSICGEHENCTFAVHCYGQTGVHFPKDFPEPIKKHMTSTVLPVNCPDCNGKMEKACRDSVPGHVYCLNDDCLLHYVVYCNDHEACIKTSRFDHTPTRDLPYTVSHSQK